MEGAYKKQAMDYSHNMADRSPNVDEEGKYFNSTSDRASTTGISDKVGVEDGLGDLATLDTRYENHLVTENQRLESHNETVTSSTKGKFRIGS